MTEPPIDETGHKGDRLEELLVEHALGESERTAYTNGFNDCLDRVLEEFDEEGVDRFRGRVEAMRKGR